MIHKENATTGLGLSNLENSTDTIYGVLNGTKTISDVIRKTEFKNLDIITSNVDLSGLEVETADDSMRAFILKRELTSYLNDSRATYDYVLIDCPPITKSAYSHGSSVFSFAISSTTD